jgi:hypothetical protein
MQTTVRRAIARAALAGAAAATACLAVASAAPAEQSGHSCPSFSRSKLTYQLFISDELSCAYGKRWVSKLSKDRVTLDPEMQNVRLKNGPSGYGCFARARKMGHASSGICYKGSLAFPKSEFTWIGK